MYCIRISRFKTHMKIGFTLFPADGEYFFQQSGTDASSAIVAMYERTYKFNGRTVSSS